MTIDFFVGCPKFFLRDHRHSQQIENMVSFAGKRPKRLFRPGQAFFAGSSTAPRLGALFFLFRAYRVSR